MSCGNCARDYNDRPWSRDNPLTLTPSMLCKECASLLMLIYKQSTRSAMGSIQCQDIVWCMGPSVIPELGYYLADGPIRECWARILFGRWAHQWMQSDDIFCCMGPSEIAEVRYYLANGPIRECRVGILFGPWAHLWMQSEDIIRPMHPWMQS